MRVRRFLRRAGRWTLLVLVASYAGVTLSLWHFQDRLVYVPPRPGPRTPTDAGLPYEDVWLDTRDGVRIHGWFVPGAEVADEPEADAILFFHGAGTPLVRTLGRCAEWRARGLDSLLVDYRGYGRSEGTPTEEGLYLDADAAWAHLTAERGLEPRRIVVWGHSLGGGVASWLAERETPAALVLGASFTSLVDAGLERYPWAPVRLLARNRYPTIDRMAGLRCPVVVAHDRGDPWHPFHHGERLFEAAREPKVFVDTTRPVTVVLEAALELVALGYIEM